MAKSILISEKPSVALEFAKVLGINAPRKDGYIESDDWVITWCVGHLVTMSYPEVYDKKLKSWSLQTLPFMPKEYLYETLPNVKKQFNIIKALLTRDDIDVVYVATDSGREGEYIYRLVEKQIGIIKPNRKRIWIDSQTEDEIKRGIKEAKDLTEYDSLSDSAFLRAKEDYLIGINFSRLLTLKYAKMVAKHLQEDRVVIAVGRVMTCVLGMIVTREREIRNFVKTQYYRVIAEFGDNENGFKAEWKVQEKSSMFESQKLYNESGFKKEDDAKELINVLKDKKAKILEVKKSKTKENAPLLFNLAEMQNECTKRFKIKPDETLEVVQALYEKKLVTYPRTDARVISTAVAKEISKNLNGIAKGCKDEELQGYIKKMVEEKYSTNIEKSKYVNDSKITDHYAIIPTGQGFENYERLNQLQKDVYKIIVKRFLAIFYPSAEFNKVSVIVDIDNEYFYANGKVCIKKGFLEILNEKKGTKDNIEENLDILNSLKKGQEVEIKNFEIKESETTPPSRYNSGSIILAMENAGKLIEDEELREQIKGAGIGTSATRAEIMKKLERITYIQINNKTQIVTPTKRGEAIFDVVNKSIPDMLNPKLTASWEKGLEMVANKQIDEKEFMIKLEKFIQDKINN